MNAAHFRIDIDPTAQCDAVMDAARMADLKDNCFTRVLMREVLEHIHNPYQALREIWRVLRPSGVLWLTIPNTGTLARFLRWLREGRLSCSPEHLYGWSLPEIENLLWSTGFRVRQVRFGTIPRFNPVSRWLHLCPRLFAESVAITATKEGATR